MNTSIATWLLAGALAASVAWNLAQHRAALPRPPEPASPAEGCVGAPDLGALGLSESQRAAAEAWCRGSCESSCGLQLEAEEKLALLHAALRDPASTPDSLRELAAEVSRLRERSLAACVDSIVELRAVLSAEQLDGLMQCCPTPESPAQEPSKP